MHIRDVGVYNLYTDGCRCEEELLLSCIMVNVQGMEDGRVPARTLPAVPQCHIVAEAPHI